jgi:hypothetical protein
MRLGRMMATIEGATPAQANLLREILDGLGGRVQHVHVRDHEPEFEELIDLGAEIPTGPYGLELSLQTIDDSTQSWWEGQLLAGAARARFQQDGLGRVNSVSRPNGGSTVDHTRPLPLDPPAERDGVVLRALVEAAGGQELDQLEILRPYGFAAAATLRVLEPHSFIRLALKGFLEQSSHYSGLWDGSYAEVRDEADAPAWISAYAGRTTSGAGSVRPDVECCAEATFASRRGMDWEGPPPCPVFDRVT